MHIATDVRTICDRILESSSKSHMKYAVFYPVFKVISVNVYVIPEYFLNKLGNLCYESTQYHEISQNCNTIHVEMINISNYKCVIWNRFPKSGHI